MKLVLSSSDCVLKQKTVASFLIPVPRKVVPIVSSSTNWSVSLLGLKLFDLDARPCDHNDFGTLFLLSKALTPEKTAVADQLLPLIGLVHYSREIGTDYTSVIVEGISSATSVSPPSYLHPSSASTATAGGPSNRVANLKPLVTTK